MACPALDGLHYLSGGAVGFARGLNDTPKMVALLMAARAVHPNVGLALVAGVMALGGLFALWPSRRRRVPSVAPTETRALAEVAGR